MKVLNILLFISALGLSSVAAFFSIIGIATMFPGAVNAVIIMAISLEIAKIISAVWTHKYWKAVSLFSKTYLSFAIIVLMLITSMGIFGFLSKAHIEHQSVSESISLQVSQIDAKLARQAENIARNESLISKIEKTEDSVEDRDQSIIKSNNEKIDSIYDRMEKDIKIDQDSINNLDSRLSELDSQLALVRSEKGGIFSNQGKKIKDLEDSQSAERKSIAEKTDSYVQNISFLRKKAQEEVDEIRKQNESFQSKDYKSTDASISEINKYKQEINTSYEVIDKLNLEKFELSNRNLAIETEVGPVKYVAKLITDTTGEEIDLSGAVRIIIIVIIFVFDPLAIMMIVCATSQFFHQKNDEIDGSSPPTPKAPKPEPPKHPRPEPVEPEIVNTETPINTEVKTNEPISKPKHKAQKSWPKRNQKDKPKKENKKNIEKKEVSENPPTIKFSNATDLNVIDSSVVDKKAHKIKVLSTKKKPKEVQPQELADTERQRIT